MIVVAVIVLVWLLLTPFCDATKETSDIRLVFFLLFLVSVLGADEGWYCGREPI